MRASSSTIGRGIAAHLLYSYLLLLDKSSVKSHTSQLGQLHAYIGADNNVALIRFTDYTNNGNGLRILYQYADKKLYIQSSSGGATYRTI